MNSGPGSPLTTCLSLATEYVHSRSSWGDALLSRGLYKSTRDRAAPSLACCHLTHLLSLSIHCVDSRTYLPHMRVTASHLQYLLNGQDFSGSPLRCLKRCATWAGISWRALAKEIGVSASLLSRISNGQKPDADGFATIVRWLGLPAEQFIDDDNETPATPDVLVHSLRYSVPRKISMTVMSSISNK